MILHLHLYIIKHHFQFDSNKIAALSKDSHTVTIIDTRQPGIPSSLVHHPQKLTSIKWSRLIPDTLYSSDVSGILLSTSIDSPVLHPESSLLYTAESPIQSMTSGQGIIALSVDHQIDIVKAPTIQMDEIHAMNSTDNFL